MATPSLNRAPSIGSKPGFCARRFGGRQAKGSKNTVQGIEAVRGKQSLKLRKPVPVVHCELCAGSDPIGRQSGSCVSGLGWFRFSCVQGQRQNENLRILAVASQRGLISDKLVVRIPWSQSTKTGQRYLCFTDSIHGEFIVALESTSCSVLLHHRPITPQEALRSFNLGYSKRVTAVHRRCRAGMQSCRCLLYRIGTRSSTHS